MTVALDPDAARAAARALSATGDSLYDEAFVWRTRFDDLDLGGEGFAGRQAIECAAAELWRNAAFLGLTSDRVEAIDAGTIGTGAVDGAHLDGAELWRLATGLARRHGWLGPWREMLGASPASGDRTGTFDAELRRPLHVYGTDGVGRARSMVSRLLADLSDPMQIRADEFALVQLADDRFIVVLPGVTDLSSPDLFLSDEHRSARDLDRYALPSSRSSAVADNRYAELVWQALEAADVPRGSELLFVGHSFGADTALDLAADPTFNGERFAVTHVVAAGYHSQPQLRSVAGSTRVLVLQNHRDAAVIVEGVGHSNAAKSVTSRVGVLTDTARLDLPGAVRHVVDVFEHDAGTAIDVGGFVWDHTDEAGEISIGVGSGNWPVAVGAAAELFTLEPRVERVGDRAVVDVFEGHGDGVGHHPSNYIDHIRDVDHPDVVAFLASLSAGGYDADGSIVAIDVSVPAS